MKKVCAVLLTLCLLSTILFGTVLAEGTPTDLQTAASEPAATTTPEASDAATTPEASDTATTPEASDATTTPEASDATTTPEVTEAPTSGPAYVIVDGVTQYGSIEDLIPVYFATGATIFLQSDAVQRVGFWTTQGIANVHIAPDRTLFPDEAQVVLCSAVSPDGLREDNVIYLWVGYPSELPGSSVASPDLDLAEDDEVLEQELQATATDYTADAPCRPTFTLTAIPDLGEGASYGVMVDDGTPERLTGNTYAPQADGTYRFVVLDAAGKITARSAQFAVTYEDTEDSAPAVPNVMLGSPRATATDLETTAPIPEGDEEEAEEDVPLTITSAAAPQITPELIVTSSDLNEGMLSDIAPSFKLSGAPDATYVYAVSVDGAAPSLLQGTTYTATQEGAYTLQFFLLDSTGAQVAASKTYSLDLRFSTDSNIHKQAWMLAPDGVTRIYGTLDSLLAQASSGAAIYLLTADTVVLSGRTSLPGGVTLLPDPGVFATSAARVVASTVNPASVTSADGSLFVYVTSASSASAADTVELTVTASDNYSGAAWSNKVPRFALAYTSAANASYTWGVSFDGSSPVTISGSAYAAEDEGAYAMTFVLLDGAGSVVASSAPWAVALDFTSPLMNLSAQGLTLTVVASDATSGMDAVSVNGGTTWYTMTETTQGVYAISFTASDAASFAAGVIRVRDNAGNVTLSEKEVALSASTAPSGSFGGGSSGGFGGGSGGASTTATTHASSDVETVTAYDGMQLVIDNAAMTVLTIGNTPLDLSLELDARNAKTVPDYTPAFNAKLTALGAADSPDTLILTASSEGITELPEEYAFTWEFSGTVYKKLAASGIEQMVLCVGDQMTVLSTAGFSAGLRYAMYRAQGLNSREFVYRVTMGTDGTMTMSATVEGETYLMTDNPSDDFYYYDVLHGTAESLALTAQEG